MRTNWVVVVPIHESHTNLRVLELSFSSFFLGWIKVPSWLPTRDLLPLISIVTWAWKAHGWFRAHFNEHSNNLNNKLLFIQYETNYMLRSYAKKCSFITDRYYKHGSSLQYDSHNFWQKRFRPRAHNVSIVNTIGGPTRSLHEHKNLCFGIESYIDMSSINYEANHHGHGLDLLIISH